MHYNEVKKRIDAAYSLLRETSTTKEKFESIRTLLHGINPKIDEKLTLCSKELTKIDQIKKGAVIELIADNIPENTEEQKRRKRYLLLFIKWWNDLKSEVKRVQAEFEKSKHKGQSSHSVSAMGKIFSFAKGPLGIITIAAVGVVVTLQAISVNITIRNQGCSPINPATTVPVSLPGFSLPKEAIESGQSAVATIPAIPVTVNATNPNSITVSISAYTLPFDLTGGDVDFIFDGTSLLNKNTSLNLGGTKEHELIVSC